MTKGIRGLNKNVIDIFICLYVYYKVVESTKNSFSVHTVCTNYSHILYNKYRKKVIKIVLRLAIVECLTGHSASQDTGDKSISCGNLSNFKSKVFINYNP